MKLKNVFFIILIVAFVVTTVGLYIYQDHNDYVFKVNDEKVTVAEFNTYFNLQKKIMEAQYGENVWNTLLNDAPAIETARDSAKKSIVDTKIKLQQAKSRNISLTSTEKQSIRSIVKANGTEIMKQYGLGLDDLVKINEDAAIIQKLSIALYKETDHSTHEHGKIDIEKYESGEEFDGPVKTYDSRHILFGTQGKTAEEKATIKTQAEAVLARVKSGEDFASLAKQYSEDPGSKDNGGLYLGIKSGEFVSEYEKAALSLKDGEIYPELVESQHGYHIIKLEKINNPDAILSRTETSTVLDSELSTVAQKWLEDAKVDINQQQYDSFATTNTTSINADGTKLDKN